MTVYTHTADTESLKFSDPFMRALSSSSYSTPLLIQGPKTVRGTSSPIEIVLDEYPIEGDVMIAVIGVQSNPNTSIGSVTQDNVTWYPAKRYAGVSYYNVEIWYGIVGESASKSILVTADEAYDFGQGASVTILEYSGIDTDSPVDQTAQNNGNDTTPDTGTTDTTTVPSELWVGGTLKKFTSQSTPTNGFTLYDGVVQTYESTAALVKIVSSTGVANCSTTAPSGESNVWVGCIATFKSSVSGPVGFNGVLLFKVRDFLEDLKFSDTKEKIKNLIRSFEDSLNLLGWKTFLYAREFTENLELSDSFIKARNLVRVFTENLDLLGRVSKYIKKLRRKFNQHPKQQVINNTR